MSDLLNIGAVVAGYLIVRLVFGAITELNRKRGRK